MAVVLGNFAFGPPAAAANAERLTDKSSQVRRAAVLQVYEKHDQSPEVDHHRKTPARGGPHTSCRSLPALSCPIEFGTAFLGVGDRRAQLALEATSPNRDEESEATAREKRPQKRPFCRLRKPISKKLMLRY